MQVQALGQQGAQLLYLRQTLNNRCLGRFLRETLLDAMIDNELQMAVLPAMVAEPGSVNVRVPILEAIRQVATARENDRQTTPPDSNSRARSDNLNKIGSLHRLMK